MLRIGFVFCSSAFVVAALLAGACSNIADDCEVTTTCDPIGGGASGGSSSGASGKGGKASGGSDAGNGGASTAGASSGGPGGGGEAGNGEGGMGDPPCDGACMAPTPACQEATGTCVECLAPADCTTGAEDKCDTATNTCVECLEAADCGTPTAARCEGGACIECESNDDCGHIAGKGVCDAGTCVTCSPTDETGCEGKSCNPATKECTNTTTGSVGTCKPCRADSECVGGNKADPDARCVPMEFNGAAREDGFCLRRVAKGCTAPFTVTFPTMSVSGAATEGFCGINQTNTTCEAVLDLSAGRTCMAGEDASCGCQRDGAGACIAAGQGGLCRTVGGVAKSCTYACGTTPQCPGGTACTIDDPYCH